MLGLRNVQTMCEISYLRCQIFFLSAKNGAKVRKYALLQQSLEGVGEANLISRTRDSVKTYFRLMK